MQSPVFRRLAALVLAIMAVYYCICNLFFIETFDIKHNKPVSDFDHKQYFKIQKSHSMNSSLETNAIKCLLADLKLDEPGFMKVVNMDNSRRGYKPLCLPSSRRFFDSTIDSKLVRVNGGKDFWNETSCCYRRFIRKSPEDDIGIVDEEECISFHSDEMKLPPEFEFIKIECIANNSNVTKGKIIYSELLSFVSLKPAVEDRIANYQASFPEDENKRVSVIVAGLDAVSQANFLRYLPDTHKYILKNLSGIHFTKYHRTEANSFRNMLALHSGMYHSEIVESCYPNASSFLDTCPLIWKEFAENGFRTAYAEDAVPWSIFWYRGAGKGFLKQPTDYYHLPITRRMEYFDGYKGEPTPPVCYGDKYDHTVIIENILQTAFTLKDKLYFQFAWMCAMTHNVAIMTKYIGNAFIEMFQKMQQHKLAQNSVFILLGDHGMHFGTPIDTNQGQLETNLPFFYMIFPEWFYLKYPRAMKNLKENSQLLTSHFDAHETLKDFMDLSTITDESLIKREANIKYDKMRGISLFLPIPKSRDCQSAGIPSKYCSCWILEDVEVTNNALVADAYKYLQNNYNSYITKTKCLKAEIKFGEVRKAKCTMPISDPVRKQIKLEDYETLGINVQCVLTFENRKSNQKFVAAMTSSKNIWTINSIKAAESTKDILSEITEC